jgi:hypothetical protein
MEINELIILLSKIFIILCFGITIKSLLKIFIDLFKKKD